MANERDITADGTTDLTRADCHVVSEVDEHGVRTMLKFEMTIESVTIDLYTVYNDKKVRTIRVQSWLVFAT